VTIPPVLHKSPLFCRGGCANRLTKRYRQLPLERGASS
jgi:hypothetical protein